ncbi:MAG: hypothetical protein CR975_03720 [Gammaproteobacteria bacterium]|nr:MAG: hypothetical protein CR975_03720 [Gammaproteobacteria bacterium]
MRNRIVGGIAFALGLLCFISVLLGYIEVETKAWVIAVCFGLFFLVLGAWQLLTGKGMASMLTLIVSGKVTEDNHKK